MWNKPETTEKCPDPFKDKVKCAECMCWLDKYDAYKVKNHGFYGSYDEYFCRAHKKPYNEIRLRTDSIEYRGQVVMDKDGNPIKKPKSPLTK